MLTMLYGTLLIMLSIVRKQLGTRFLLIKMFCKTKAIYSVVNMEVR